MFLRYTQKKTIICIVSETGNDIAPGVKRMHPRENYSTTTQSMNGIKKKKERERTAEQPSKIIINRGNGNQITPSYERRTDLHFHVSCVS